MKKLLSVILTALTIIVPFTAAYGEGKIKVLLDGGEIVFDVPPQIIESRTFVPMRAIFEALGANVEWDGSTQIIMSEKDGTDIIMTIGYNMMFVNYSPVMLDAPPQIIDGRTLVPVRAIAESFDCDVQWYGDTRTVAILSAEKKQVEYSIEYDDTAEKESGSVGRFQITNIKKISNGKYEISYTLQTYQDGSGKMAVVFECLDENNAVIDRFSGFFYNDAYNWTDQTGTAVISGDTVKIKLAE